MVNHHKLRDSLLAASLLLIPAITSAQVGDARSRLAVGINGGINMSKVSFNPTIKQSNLNGLNGGLTIRYTCEKYFSTLCSIQLEANYSQRGWKEKIEDNDNTYQRTINYLEIPFMAHLSWGKEYRGMQFFLNAGPQANMYISDKEEKGGGTWDASTRPNHVTAQYGKAVDNKFDYGIAAGAGFEFATKLGHFTLEARYYYGLGDVFGATKKDYFSRSGNSSTIVKFSYLIDLTK